MEGHKTEQPPTQRPGGKEELLGLTFHPDPLSVCSSWHWSHILSSHRKAQWRRKAECGSHSSTVQTGPSQDLLMCLQASSRGPCWGCLPWTFFPPVVAGCHSGLLCQTGFSITPWSKSLKKRHHKGRTRTHGTTPSGRKPRTCYSLSASPFFDTFHNDFITAFWYMCGYWTDKMAYFLGWG